MRVEIHLNQKEEVNGGELNWIIIIMIAKLRTKLIKIWKVRKEDGSDFVTERSCKW